MSHNLSAFDEVRLKCRRPTGAYRTHLAEKAAIFPSYDNAALFAYDGFNPEQLPNGSWTLRDATGDWIESLVGWWEHSPNAEASFTRAYRSSLKRFLAREGGFFKP